MSFFFSFFFQIFNHAGIAQHSTYILANLEKEAGTGEGATTDQTNTCIEMYEKFIALGNEQLTKHDKPFLAGTNTPTIADFRLIPQFSDGVYNDEESCKLGKEMQDRVRDMIEKKPVLKKWIDRMMLEVIKDVRTPNLMW